MPRPSPPPIRHRRTGKERPQTLGKLRVQQAASDERPFDPEAPRERYARPHHFAVNGDAKDIVNAMARTFWLSAWADAEEEAGRSYPGQEIDDVAPTTPPAAYAFARRLAKKIRGGSDATLYGLYELCRDAPGRHAEEPTEEAFGSDLAMMMMGHGVSWWDDHPEPAEGDVLADLPDTAGQEHGLVDDADDEEADDEADEDRKRELRRVLENALYEFANQDCAVILSSVGDEDDIWLEKHGYDAQTAVGFGSCGDAIAVNESELVDPALVHELGLDTSEGSVLLWSEARDRSGRRADTLYIQHLRKQGYELVEGRGGDWPGGMQAEIEVESVLRHLDEELEDDHDVELARAVLEERFGAKRDLVYWESTDGEAAVYACPIDEDDE